MSRKQWLLVEAERLWDAARLHRRAGRPPEHFRIEVYGGHGGPAGVVVRGRVLDNPPSSEAVEGEGLGAAIRRSLGQFATEELPGVPLEVTVGDAVVEVVTDGEGYFRARLTPTDLRGPWEHGEVALAREYRGLTDRHATPIEVLVPGADARFGLISDIDDTIIETGVQKVGEMLLQTFAGSALTRTPFEGAPELYRDLADGANPVFYVSSSPWNLHTFLVAFLRHRDFPLGPLLLRDLIGTKEGRARKHERIEEVLAMHPQLRFVLIGDSGEHDPQIYAEIVRAHPGRILAVYIREVRLDPGDGRVEQITDAWDADVPFVLAADSAAVRRHAESMGLLGPAPYFGDHPDGAYWSAHPIPGAREATGPSPWVRTEPRTPDDPYPLRMFAEDSCEFALWGPLDEPPPGVDWGDGNVLLEDVLPIPAALRAGLIDWARQNTLVRSDLSAGELDRLGFDLSRQLAEALGPLFSVEYSPAHEGPHLADLRARADLDPMPGWSLRR